MSAWTSSAPEQLEAWRRLGTLAQSVVAAPRGRSSTPFSGGSERLGPLLIDYSKQRLDDESKRALVALAEQSELLAAIAKLCAGERVNVTENRAARHMDLRMSANAKAEVADERRRFLALAESVRNGTWRGATGRPAAAVVHIGIGGSHLGPRAGRRRACAGSNGARSPLSRQHGRPRRRSCAGWPGSNNHAGRHRFQELHHVGDGAQRRRGEELVLGAHLRPRRNRPSFRRGNGQHRRSGAIRRSASWLLSPLGLVGRGASRCGRRWACPSPLR